MKMSFTCRYIFMQINSFSFEWFRRRTRFENEAKGFDTIFVAVMIKISSTGPSKFKS